MNRILSLYRIIMIVFCLFCLSVGLLAVPACPNVFSVQQSDGTMLNIRLRGDEFYNWVETEEGYPVIKDLDGVYKYAMVQNNTLCVSAYVAHNVSNQSSEEIVYLKQSKFSVYEYIQQQYNSKMVTQVSSEETDTLSMRKITIPANGTKGKRVILTILVDFSDLPFTKTAAEFHNLMNQKEYKGGGNAGSVHDFYYEDSYGKLDVSSIVVGPYTARFKSDHYKWDKNGSTIRVRELVRDAVHWASSRVDFSTLDGDGNDYVDCVHLVIAGYDRSALATGIIWPHQSELSSAIIRDGKKVKKYIVTAELQKNNEIAAIGTICHELGHAFGAPDYYDIDAKDEDTGFPGTGLWDLMAYGSWNNNGKCPAHHNPYTKCYLYKWAIPSVLSPTLVNGYATIPSSYSVPAFLRVNTSVANEFFLFEYRKAIGFDKHIPREGLLIYHAHASLQDNIASNSVNNTHPQKMYIVNAFADAEPNADHSSYGLVSESFKWVYPGTGYNKNMFFTANSVPAAIDWAGKATGVDLCYINPLNSVLTFMVNPQIQGPDIVCDEEEFSLSHVPADAKVTWSYKANFTWKLFPPVLFPNGKEGDAVIIKRGCDYRNIVNDKYPINDSLAVLPMKLPVTTLEIPYEGIVDLKATIECGKKSYTISKKIEFPTTARPMVDKLAGGGIGPWKLGESKTLTITNCQATNGRDFQWVTKMRPISQPNIEVDDSMVYVGRTVEIKPTTRGIMQLHVTNLAGCAPQNDTIYSFLVTVGKAKVILKHNNPISGSALKIEIVEENDIQEPIRLQKSSPLVYTLELWSNQFGRMRQMQMTDKEFVMDIAGLPAGLYELVLLLNDDIITTSRLFIER